MVSTLAQPQATTSSIGFPHNPAAAIADDTMHTLWCLVQGESMVFKVTASANASVDQLKELVREEGMNGTLGNIDAEDLVLLKVSPIPESSMNVVAHFATLSQVDIDLNIHTDSLSRLDIKEYDEGVQKLTGWMHISRYWSPQGPRLPSGKLHIFVKLPAAGEWELVLPAYEQY
jgi:hypothetical protein